MFYYQIAARGARRAFVEADSTWIIWGRTARKHANCVDDCIVLNLDTLFTIQLTNISTWNLCFMKEEGVMNAAFSVRKGKIFECLWLPLQLPRSEREEKIGESNAFLLFAVTEWWWKEVFALLPLDNNLSHFDGAKNCKQVAAQQVAAGGQRQNNRRPTNMANLTW